MTGLFKRLSLLCIIKVFCINNRLKYFVFKYLKLHRTATTCPDCRTGYFPRDARENNKRTIASVQQQLQMAVQFLFRSVPLLRLSVQHHRLAAVIFTPPCRPFSTEASESFQPAESLSSRAICSNEDPPKYSRGNDLDDVKWKVKEDEILRDIEPMTYLTREILHSKR